MHIAMLSVHSSPLARLGGKEAGGMNVYVRELSRELGQRGVSVDIFTRHQDSALPWVVPLAPGVQVVHVSAGPVEPYDKNRILDYRDEFVDGVCRFASQQSIVYDLIHSHYWVSGDIALLLRRQWGLPIVQMFHTLGALKNTVARSAEETETARRVAIERHLLHNVDVIVAATTTDRDQMLRHYDADAKRIRIIPPGVNTQHFRPILRAEARAHLGLPPEQQVLLGVGRMEPLKGFDALIQACALLREHQPGRAGHLHVLLVGGESEARPSQWNSEQRRLAALRESLGVADAITFLGALPHEALPYYYAAANVFVMPSHYESFGMAALEAMACGTPVVASNVGGLRIIIEDGQNGLLAPPDNAPVLAERLDRVLQDEQRRALLRQGALQRAAEYSWPRITDILCSLYEECIRC
jgi:D-inositol-3-phosphate glycosyltransferase